MNHVTPTPEAIESARRRDPEQPVEMINLLKFADRADPALGLGDLSGRACYFDHYLTGASEVASALGTGPSVVYANDVRSCFLATVGEDWDSMLVVRYPNRRAFLGLVTSDEYAEVAGYRTGSLVNSRLIECIGTEPDGYPRSLHAPEPVDPLLEGPGLFRDERVNAVFDRDQAQPTDMLNLIRLAEVTRPGGGVDGLSGAEGYEIYRTGVATEYAERAGVEIHLAGVPGGNPHRPRGGVLGSGAHLPLRLESPDDVDVPRSRRLPGQPPPQAQRIDHRQPPHRDHRRRRLNGAGSPRLLAGDDEALADKSCRARQPVETCVRSESCG